MTKNQIVQPGDCLDTLSGQIGFPIMVINGVISVPIMVVMMLMAVRPEIMGQFVISTGLRVLGWLATLMMAAAVLAMLLTL